MISPASILQLTIMAITLSTASATPIIRRQGGPTRNDLINGACAEVTVIFARGTTEAGNVGSIAGPPFFGALEDEFSDAQVAIQGVDYPADVAGFLAGGSIAGAATMAGHVRTARKNCPNTKIVLSGYSQGAQVTHLAAALLTSAEALSVNSIVLFGDPNNGDRFPGTLNNNVKTFCRRGDLICAGKAIVLAPHLAYGSDARAAADFAAGKL